MSITQNKEISGLEVRVLRCKYEKPESFIPLSFINHLSRSSTFAIEMNEMKFDKNGLIPAIIQDSKTRKVLMLGYMNEKSWKLTQETKRVTFWSRSRKEIWTKGETSGNYLNFVSGRLDCDRDALLIKANPTGPVCHSGSDTCWDGKNEESETLFIDHLEAIIADRYESGDTKSYTASLFQKGTNKIAQKVGEEAVELVIESKDDNDDLFLGEAADLLFHYLVLLKDRGMALADVIAVLKKRHK